MFVIFGTTTKNTRRNCIFYAHNAKYKIIRFIKYAKSLTLFFIPLFAIAIKNRHVEARVFDNFYARVLENNRFNADGTLIELEKKVAAEKYNYYFNYFMRIF